MSCSPSARTIICNEIFDENSLPSEEEVLDYAVKIGIDPDSEPHLLNLARDGLMQALPPGWKPCFDEELQLWYYFNFKTGESQWEHPLDDVYRRLVVKSRSESISSAGEDDSKTSLKEELKSYEEGLGSEGLGSTGGKPTGVSYLKKSSIQLAPLKKSPLSPVVALPGTMVATGGRVQTATPGGRAEPLRVDLRSPSDREVVPLSRNRIDIDKMGAATLLGRPSPGPIDIDKMSVAPLLGESGDSTVASRRSALPPSAQEKHPRSLVQQGRAELKLSGGGSVFLKSRQQQQQPGTTATTPTPEDTPVPSTGTGGSGDESSTRRGILREQRSGSTETRDDSVRSGTPLWEMNPAHMTGEQKQQWRRQELEDEQRKSVRFNLLDSADLDIRFQTSDNENDEENGSEEYEEERLENNKEETWDSEDEVERREEEAPKSLKKVTVSIPDIRHLPAEPKEEEKEDISVNEDLCPTGDEFKLETQVERVERVSESVSAEAVVVSETSDGHEIPIQETDTNSSEKDRERPVTWMAEVSVVQSTVIYDQAPENNVQDKEVREETQGHGAAVVKEGEQVEEVEEVDEEEEEEVVEEEEEEEVEEEEEEEDEDDEQAEYVSGKEVNRSGETDSKEHTTESKEKDNSSNVEGTVQTKVSAEKIDVSETNGAIHTSETHQSEEGKATDVVVNGGTGDNDSAGETSADCEKAPPVPKHKILRRILVQSDTVTESEDMVSARETVVQEDEVVRLDAPVAEKCDVSKCEGAAKGEGVSASDAISKSDPLTRSDIGTKSEGLSKSDPLTKSSKGVSASERVIRSEEMDAAALGEPTSTRDAGGKVTGKGQTTVAPNERTTESEASEVTAQSDESSRDERDEPAPNARSLPVDSKAAASPVRAVHSEEAGGNSAGLVLSRSETVETSPERDMVNGTASTSDSSPLPKLVRASQGKPEDTVACTTTATTTTSSGTSIDVDVRKEANLRLKERLQEMERQAAETVRLHREKLQAQVDAAVRELEAEQEQRLSELAERLALKEEVERERIISDSRCRLDAIRVNTEQQERILRAECEMRLQQLEADCRARLEASQQARAEELARIEAEDEAQLREARARLAAKQAELQRQVDAAIAEREALLAKHRKELADLEKEVRPEQLSEEHREALDKLRAEQEAALERIKAQFQHEEEAVRQEHAERLEELKVRLELERQRLWDRGLVDDNESARQQLVETSRVFEKLRCEKRLLEDKYRTLKEKYLRLKTDVKISMERRKRREAALNSGGTGSDSERIVSQRATGTSGPVFERSKSLNTEKSRSAAERQRQLSTAVEGTVVANRGGNGTAQQQAQPGSGKLLTGEAREAHNINDSNKGGTIGSSNNNNNSSNNNNDISNTGGNNTNTNNNSTRRRRQLFSRHHSTPTTRTTNNNAANINNNIAHSVDVDIDGEIDGNGGRSCSPVENLRRQLRTLEDLEDQFPAASHTDTYLRYPFSDTGKFGSSELEFFRHRIHLERDSVRRAKDFLRMQRDSFQARQNELRQRQEGRGPSARTMLDQLYKEERELTDMEVSLHRTKSLLGEKIIRLRHLEQSLQRAGEFAPNGQVDNSHAVSGGPGGTTLSDLSSHSGSSGFSSTELATDTQGQVNDMARRGAHYQESTEIIKSLENLNTEIREIWDVLNKQPKDGNIASNSLPPPPPLAYTWVPPVTVPVAVPAYHHPPPAAQLRRYGVPDAAPPQSGLDRSLVERTRSLRDWLRQARLDGNAARGVSPGAGQTRVTTAAI